MPSCPLDRQGGSLVQQEQLGLSRNPQVLFILLLLLLFLLVLLGMQLPVAAGATFLPAFSPPAAEAAVAADENERNEDDERQTHQHSQADRVEDTFLMLGTDELQDGIKERADLLLHVSSWAGCLCCSLRLKALWDMFSSWKQLVGSTNVLGWCLQRQNHMDQVPAPSAISSTELPAQPKPQQGEKSAATGGQPCYWPHPFGGPYLRNAASQPLLGFVPGGGDGQEGLWLGIPTCLGIWLSTNPVPLDIHLNPCLATRLWSLYSPL